MNAKILWIAAWACSNFVSCQKHTVDASNLAIDKSKIVGGGCDGCELMYIGMPEKIYPADTSPGWSQHGKKIVISGTVFKRDGKTPAAGVIMYYWQTDDSGKYTSRPGLDPKAVRHGYIRGWVKTGKDGKYSIATIRPTPYPGRDIPAHIHLAVKEPDIANEYYIDEINFDDDPLLIPYAKKYRLERRGGSGIVKTWQENGETHAVRDITLGLHVPAYPVQKKESNPSGLEVGDRQPSFMPFHAYGPDKGSRACPVCKYGRRDGILYFVGAHPNWNEIETWLTFLEQEAAKRQNTLKVYFIYGNPSGYDKQTRDAQLKTLGIKLGIVHTALTYVPSFQDTESECNLNEINPDVFNTFVIYRNGRIIDKYINLKADAEGFGRLAIKR